MNKTVALILDHMQHRGGTITTECDPLGNTTFYHSYGVLLKNEDVSWKRRYMTERTFINLAPYITILDDDEFPYRVEYELNSKGQNYHD